MSESGTDKNIGPNLLSGADSSFQRQSCTEARSKSRRSIQLVEILMTLKTDLNDCADLFVAVAKNSSMTGQSIVVGKSMVACSQTRLTTVQDSGLSDIH